MIVNRRILKCCASFHTVMLSKWFLTTQIECGLSFPSRTLKGSQVMLRSFWLDILFLHKVHSRGFLHRSGVCNYWIEMIPVLRVLHCCGIFRTVMWYLCNNHIIYIYSYVYSYFDICFLSLVELLRDQYTSYGYSEWSSVVDKTYTFRLFSYIRFCLQWLWVIYGRRALEMLCDSNKCFSHKNTYVSFIIVEALNEALVILYAFRVKHVIWRKYNLGDLLLTKDCLCLMNRDAVTRRILNCCASVHTVMLS